METYKNKLINLVKKQGATDGKGNYALKVNQFHSDGSEKCSELFVENDDLLTYWEATGKEDYLTGWVYFDNIAPSELDALLELIKD